jgi:hypothetical protein
LGDEELGGARPEAVADPDNFFEKTLCREVLPERTPGEIYLRKLPAPIGIVLGGVDIDGLLRTPVHREVGLPVAFEV